MLVPNPLFAAETFNLQEYPYPIKLHGRDLTLDPHHLAPNALITGFSFRDAEVSVHPKAKLATGQLQCLVLASFGLSNERIAGLSCRTDNTVKTHLRIGFNKLREANTDSSNIDRSSIATCLLTLGGYVITKTGSPLGLRPAELPVVAGIAAGKSNPEIGEQLDRSHLTVKAHIARIARRTGVNQREAMAMTALLSGEVDFSTPQQAIGETAIDAALVSGGGDPLFHYSIEAEQLA